MMEQLKHNLRILLLWSWPAFFWSLCFFSLIPHSAYMRLVLPRAHVCLDQGKVIWITWNSFMVSTTKWGCGGRRTTFMLDLWGYQPTDWIFNGKIQGPLNPREKDFEERVVVIILSCTQETVKGNNLENKFWSPTSFSSPTYRINWKITSFLPKVKYFGIWLNNNGGQH